MKAMHIHKSVILSDWYFSKEQKSRSFKCIFILDCFPTCHKMYEDALP